MPWPSLKLNYWEQRYYSWCTHVIPCLGNGFHKQNIVMTWKSCAKSRRAQALSKELADLSADASQAGLWSGLLKYLPGSYWINNNCSTIFACIEYCNGQKPNFRETTAVTWFSIQCVSRCFQTFNAALPYCKFIIFFVVGYFLFRDVYFPTTIVRSLWTRCGSSVTSWTITRKPGLCPPKSHATGAPFYHVSGNTAKRKMRHLCGLFCTSCNISHHKMIEQCYWNVIEIKIMKNIWIRMIESAHRSQWFYQDL